MAFRYKQYINKAFWNSLVVVLCVLVLVVIAVYAVTILAPEEPKVADIPEPDSQIDSAEFEQKMRLLESLSNDNHNDTDNNIDTNNQTDIDNYPTEVDPEKISVLESLSTDDNAGSSLTNEERLNLLDSL